MTSTLDIQKRLLALGFNPGAVDGVPGPKTTDAIRSYQHSISLVADGVAGPKTLAALFPAGNVAETPAAGAILTAAVIRKVCPSARADLVAEIAGAGDRLTRAGITTKLRAAHFLSQIATETGGLRAIEENLNYSAARLVKVWPKRFPTAAAAKPFANNPEALANKVYGGRLGNTKAGDGWRYRGGGMMQTTGRSNYRSAGHENDPEALRLPGPALDAALHYWSTNGCNELADRDNVDAVRTRVNGGTNGIAETRTYLKKAKAALG